jgi:osmoprotectant transport system ATP-binding protein
MREGRLIQYDTPLNILSNPADEFVARLVGANDVLRRLSLQPVASVMLPWNGSSTESISTTHKIMSTGNLRDAMNMLLANPDERLIVSDEENYPIGSITLEAIHNFAQLNKVASQPPVARPGK